MPPPVRGRRRRAQTPGVMGRTPNERFRVPPGDFPPSPNRDWRTITGPTAHPGWADFGRGVRQFGMGPVGGQTSIPRWLSDMFRTQIAPRLNPTIGTALDMLGAPAQFMGNQFQQGFGNRMSTAMGQMAGYTPPSPLPDQFDQYIRELTDPTTIAPSRIPVPETSIPQPLLDALNTGITGRPVQTGRTEGGFAPVQAPIGQQNQYVGPTPMEAWESNLGGSPSFAQTMGQLGRQRAQQQADAPRTRAAALSRTTRNRRGGL